jgi:hypothetical protein
MELLLRDNLTDELYVSAKKSVYQYVVVLDKDAKGCNEDLCLNSYLGNLRGVNKPV